MHSMGFIDQYAYYWLSDVVHFLVTLMNATKSMNHMAARKCGQVFNEKRRKKNV